MRQVMECDYASILLPEPGGEQLRVYARDFSAGGESWQEEIVVPAAGRPAGEVLKSAYPSSSIRKNLRVMEPFKPLENGTTFALRLTDDQPRPSDRHA